MCMIVLVSTIVLLRAFPNYIWDIEIPQTGVAQRICN